MPNPDEDRAADAVPRSVPPEPPFSRSCGRRRFFAASSFWNQPIPPGTAVERHSDQWIEMLRRDQTGKNFVINATRYTIPLYEVTRDTPRGVIREGSGEFHQHPNFRGQPVPLPPTLAPSPGVDKHVALVDYEQGLVWDLWHVERRPDGQWASYTGISYDLDGPGVFSPEEFPVQPGQSIHQYGPSRAAGVPAVAGLILHAEVAAGRIEHKLACAHRFVAYQEHVFPPAIWTDGNVAGGVPEGATLQLDPALDLDAFDLWPGERVIARALQEYGAVVVDFAAANALYAEGLWSDPTRSWDGIIRETQGGIGAIPLRHFRFLQLGTIRTGGDRLKPFFQDFIHAGLGSGA